MDIVMFILVTLWFSLGYSLGKKSRPTPEELMASINNMGHMIEFFCLGFELWGVARPAKCWNNNGKCYEPLFLGLWVRVPREDKHHV
jgi:hypothetical protein